MPTSATPTDRTPAGGAAASPLHPSHGPGSCDGPLDTATLGDIAAGLGAVFDDRRVEPGAVRTERLLATPQYDAWLMVWAPGTRASHHDHGGSASVVHVVAGTLAETARDIEGDADLTHLIPAGATSELGAIGSHVLANPTHDVTVSVHVYSPPIGEP
jgi:hypothetical protein